MRTRPVLLSILWGSNHRVHAAIMVTSLFTSLLMLGSPINRLAITMSFKCRLHILMNIWMNILMNIQLLLSVMHISRLMAVAHMGQVLWHVAPIAVGAWHWEGSWRWVLIHGSIVGSIVALWWYWQLYLLLRVVVRVHFLKHSRTVLCP